MEIEARNMCKLHLAELLYGEHLYEEALKLYNELIQMDGPENVVHIAKSKKKWIMDHKRMGLLQDERQMGEAELEEMMKKALRLS